MVKSGVKCNRYSFVSIATNGTVEICNEANKQNRKKTMGTTESSKLRESRVSET